jgi:RND family efflux transporter MFP subunit
MTSWFESNAAGWLSFMRLLGIVFLTAMAGCGASGGPEAGANAAGASAAAEPTVSGELLRIEPVVWPVIARVQGSLSADEVSTIAAKVSGRIVEVNCDLGDVVSAGQTLIKIDDTEYALRVVQAEAQLAQVRAAIGLKSGDPVSKLDPMRSPPVRETRALLDEAKQNVVRLQSLFAQRAIVATDLEAAQSAEQVADARFNSSLNSVREKMALVEVQAAQLELAKQQLLDTTITAPLDGVILNRLVAVGTYVPAGEPLIGLAKTNILRFRAAVPERFAQQLRTGQRVKITVSGEERESKVERISPALDPLSRSLVFEALIPNADNVLRSGLFAQAEVVLDEQATAFAIPSSALVRFAGIDKVWRVADGQVKEAVLQIGREMNDMHEVYAGLAAGDQILINGASGRIGKFIQGDPQEQQAKELVAAKVVAHEPKSTKPKSSEPKSTEPESTELKSNEASQASPPPRVNQAEAGQAAPDQQPTGP